jgi:hypothetical protein
VRARVSTLYRNSDCCMHAFRVTGSPHFHTMLQSCSIVCKGRHLSEIGHYHQCSVRSVQGKRPGCIQGDGCTVTNLYNNRHVGDVSRPTLSSL